MYNFNFVKASSIDNASLLFDESEDPVYIAGGMTLIPTLKQRLAMPTDVIDIAEIQGLSSIGINNNKLEIGAMAKHSEVASSEEVRKSIPAISHLASLIGDPQVRNRGTIGGSIANNDPSSDYPASVLGLDAVVQTNRRIIKAEDFFTGLFETNLNEGEIVTKITFPVPEVASYKKFPNPASGYAIVGVFISKMNGQYRVAITGAGPKVFRSKEIEEALKDSFSPDSIKDINISDENLNSDIHASSEYRAHLITVMAKRAISDINKTKK